MTHFDRLARGILDQHQPIAVACQCEAHQAARAWINSVDAATVADFVNGRASTEATERPDLREALIEAREFLGRAMDDIEANRWRAVEQIDAALTGATSPPPAEARERPALREALEVLLAEVEWIRDHPFRAARVPDERTIAAARRALTGTTSPPEPSGEDEA